MPPKRPPIHPSPTPSALGGKSKAQPPPALKTPQPGGPAQHPKIVQFRSGSDAPSNENSPLLRPSFPADNSYSKSTDNGSEEEDYFMDDEEEETKSTFFLFLLTLGGLGLQIGWSVETSNGSPYLLSLGLSKSMLALVWIAGPLSGALVQPYVGMKSDNCRISWGRRRPFIIGGAAATILSLMTLAWAREIMTAFLSLFGADAESYGVKTAVMVFAILFVYVLDFAINVIQAAIRAYIVDVAPTHQQESANAWMIRASGVGNILGYLAGNANLPKYLPWLGDSQFKGLCAIASFVMALTVAISCLTVSERDPKYAGPVTQQEGLINFFRSLGSSVRTLPVQIKRVCQVQFFAWIGWFPFLFYITTYIGEIYSEPFFQRNPNLSDEEITEILEEGTRLGARALLIFSLTTFAASIVLPFIIPPTYIAPAPLPVTPGPMTPRTPLTPHSLSASGYFAAYKMPPKVKQTKSLADRFQAMGEAMQIKSLTLRRSWFLSHIIFAALMALTFLVRTTLAATVLVGLIGIPWALTNWAPFALISSEISKRDAIRRGSFRPGNRAAALAALADEASETGSDQAGIVLGIHNVAIAAPQVIATLVSSIIFWALQKPRGTPGDNSVAWVLRFGGCCALVGAWLTLRVAEEKEDAEDDVSIRGPY